jgi:DmsE family decaheme c-type cytochrome
MSMRSRIGIVAVLGFLFVMSFGGANALFAADATAAATSQPSTTSMPPGDQSSPALYSEHGAATCLQCHNEAPVTNIFATPHSVKGDSRTPFGQHECESCHGPSQAHVEGFQKGAMVEPHVVFNGPHVSPVAVRNKACLSCHQDVDHMNWQGSPHDVNNVACVSCHRVHITKDPVLVKATQPAVCFTCHSQQRAESFEYSHHPIREGKVVCMDCHNPHGSAGPHLMKEFTVNETCYTCHADKRGPMLWEHQPVRENCLNCHTPHGSNEARLLKERMNFMCSSCHSAISNGSGGAFGGAHSLPGNLEGTATFSSALANNRMCLNCHSQVHGSNSPNGAYFFR